MDYNDIIIITLLVIIIGLVLLKKDNSYFTQNENSIPQTQAQAQAQTQAQAQAQTQAQAQAQAQNQLSNNYSPHKKIEYSKYNNYVNQNHFKKSNNNMNDIKPNNINIQNNNSNQGININDKLINIKNKKNKNSIMLKNNDKKSSNSLLDFSEVDLKSIDDNSSNIIDIPNMKNPNIIKNINKNKYNDKHDYKNNKKVNKKVIIDDYSEFDNIKSLNSMDNTLSDLISIIENDNKCV